MIQKPINANYLHDVPAEHRTVNQQNRIYIDRFVTENYKRLSGKFSTLDGTINSSGFGAMDKLNETLLTLYTDPDLCFADYAEAERYLSSKFTEKELRVPVKKSKRAGQEGINE